MIAITFALPCESQPLRRFFRHTGETAIAHAMLGNVGLHECLLIHTGMGPEETQERLSAALDTPLSQPPPSLLISAGYAGALVPGLEAGQLFLAENASSPELLQIAQSFFSKTTPPARTGSLYSTPTLIETPEEKATLAQETGAEAVDMETATIAAVCRERGLPLLSLRVISDNATDPLPVPFSVCINSLTGKPRIGAIALHLAQHPWRIPSFLQFAKRASGSGRALAQAIAALLPHLHPL